MINSVIKLDYPSHLLQIQVLDDSTDHTAKSAEKLVNNHRKHGINIDYIYRSNRTGFKAGALEAGLKTASGEFIVIFDADFMPPSDFLQKTIPHFLADSHVGLLQTRWGHLNDNYSPLTRAQAIALDGHFGIEQAARNQSGLLMNFNGTAGVWRRTAIDSAGGWQDDTICEDLDLSYRAQLHGWQCLYLRDVVAPAELPPQLAAFKRQQFRWAKGSIQCFKKLAPSVWQADLFFWTKLQAFIHLTGYLAHPLMVILLLTSFPLMFLTYRVDFPLAYLSFMSLAPPTMYATAIATLYTRTRVKRFSYFPILMLLGMGIALNNTKAVIEALLGVENIFRRTPKFNLERKTDKWQQSPYRLFTDRLVFGELALSFYAFLTVVVALENGNMFAVPFIMLYALSFGYVSLLGLWEIRLPSP